MLSVHVQVSLSEVLEVRGGPLADTEIWAFLCVGAELLQDLFLSGQVYNEFGPAFVINPDCIHLTVNSQVEFGSARKVQQYANYMAPETEEGFVMTSSAVEQMYVYAFGKSLIYASEYGLKNEESSMPTRMSKPVKIGDNLESLLRRMTHPNSSQRMPLVKVMEACALQKERHQRGNKSFSQTIAGLYQSVLGMETEESNLVTSLGKATGHQKDSPRRSPEGRSRRKRKHSSERGRRKQKSHEQKYRSRSHSRSRSRSRSHSKHKGHRRDADSPDSGFHRITPLPHTSYSPTGEGRENGYSNNHHHHHHHGSGRSSHLSDITSSMLLDPNQTHVPARPGASNHHSRPSSRNMSSASRGSDNPAFKKYLKLKERQRKLRALRLDNTDDDASSELSDIVLDHMSEPRSSMVLPLHGQVGAYHPDIHLKYGSSMALKMSRDSDRESVVSSEASYTPQEFHALRAQADISDPYIQQLQQLTSNPPAPPVFASQPPAVKKQKKKPGSPRSHKPGSPRAHKPGSPRSQKTRDFYGPEFVHKTSKPIQRIPIALQGESNKNPAHVCRVIVVLLNGQKLEAMVSPSTTGQQLFEAVVTEIELPEFYFFGLTYINDNEHFFIPGESKLHKVAPDGWKESWKAPSPVTFTCYLRVKFYAETLSALKHETTRHQLYLQLRRDILEERCLIDEDTALKLAGLALQAEYGDYYKETMGQNYFIPDHYFSGRTTKRLGTAYIRDNAPETHQQAAGLSETSAETEFMKIVIDLVPEYGIHFHKLLKKKGETNNVIWVGVNINNLVLAENAPNQRIIVHQYPWASIMKISFNRRRFSVQPRPEFGQLKPTKMNFYTTTYKKGQYLLKFCTAQHSFQLKLKTRLSSLDTVTDLSAGDHMSIGDTEDIDATMSDSDTITEDVLQKTETENVSQGFGATNHIPQKEPRAYRHPPPYRPDSSASMIEIPTALRESTAPVFTQPARAATTGDLVNDEAEDIEDDVEEEIIESQVFQQAQAYVIDTSLHSVDQTLSPPSGNETISNTLHQRLRDDLLSPENSYCEKEIFEVTLEKQKTHGIGITIVGGDSSNKQDVGLFVKSVTRDGPAYCDGRIKPGDRILAINGESVNGKEHHEAVKIIKHSKGPVNILISQVKPPGSFRKRDNNDEVFHAKLRESNLRHNKDTEESSSSRNDINPISNVPVITVQNASVHSHNENDKNTNKNAENSIKMDKNITDAPCSIPEIREDIEDQDFGNSTTADLHSTLSLVDSLHSEMAVSEIPDDDQQDITEVYSDSSGEDSDFDTAVNDVVENRYNSSQDTKPPRRGDVLSPITETVEIILQKKNGSFGLNVTGGVTTTVKHGGIYVKSLIENGPADLEGTVKKGDRILKVNDIELTGFTHKEAVQTLVNAPDITRLLLERPVQAAQTSELASHSVVGHLTGEVTSRDSPTAGVKVHELSPGSTTNEDVLHQAFNPDDAHEMLQVYPFQTAENTYKVELKKGTYGLGFSLFGCEVDADPPYEVVRIKRIFPIGPAADCKQVHPGDVIVAINGGDLKGLNHIETMGMIRRAGKTVSLIMCHPDSDDLPPVMDSYESLEVTPTSSTTHISDDDDSDSDIEFIPQREALITPPTGFSPSPYPVDPDGSILPKIASPPPPLPVSPPPVLVNSGEIDPSEEFEVDVPEFNESCDSELAYLQNVKQNLQAPSMNSLIVREDSALTVSSRDVTPTGDREVISRESTPYSVDSVSTTPVLELEENNTLTPRDCEKSESELDQVESEGDTGSFVQTGHSAVSELEIDQDKSPGDTGSFLQTDHSAVFEYTDTNTLDSMHNEMETIDQDIDEVKSDSDSESDNKSTSNSDDKLESIQNETDSVVEMLDNSLICTYTLDGNTVDKSKSSVDLDTEEYKKTNVNDVIISKNDVNEYVDEGESEAINSLEKARGLNISEEGVEDVFDKSGSEYSEDNDEFDDTLKQLEEKYKELSEEVKADDELNVEEEEYEAKEFIYGLHYEKEIVNNRITEEDEDLNQGDENIANVNRNDNADVNSDNDHESSDEYGNKQQGTDPTKAITSDNEFENENGHYQDDSKGDGNEMYAGDEQSDYSDDFEDNKSDDDDDLCYNLTQNLDCNRSIDRDNENQADKPKHQNNEEKSEFEDSVVESVSEREEPSLPLQPGDIEVTLTKPEGKGLGFTVAGGASTTGGCYIKAVLQNPALSDGTLKPGDKLIMVNGKDMRSLSHFDAVSALRETDGDVTIRVHRGLSDVGDTGKAGVVKSSYIDSLSQSTETSISQDEKTINPDLHDETADSESESEVNPLDNLEDSDLSVSDGADDMQCIQDLIESLTATDTHLEPADRPVERKEVFDNLSEKTGYDVQRSSPSSDMSVYQIDLQKPASGGLGISLVSIETQNQTGVFIRTITPGGVADQDGRLQEGDKILQINGESLVGMNHTKAATMLRLSQGKLSITVSRSPNMKKRRQIENRDCLSPNNSLTFNLSGTTEADDSSLSITKHVPDDITDTGVDDLVAEAERILEENSYQSDSSNHEDFVSGDVMKTHEMTKAARKYLGASGTIEYSPDEIFVDTDNCDNVDIKDKLNKIVTSDNEHTDYSSKQRNSSDDQRRNHLRSISINIPDEVTSDWLSHLPLVTIHDSFRPIILDIVSELREKISINDPQQEFKQLRIVHSTDDCTDAYLDHNKQKNRFRNVLPYNSNRVKISADDDTDYINASHIQFEIDKTLCDYIACQGPLPETTDDFWEMVWQQDVSVIAMLTLDMESMKVKCHRYWPDSADTTLEVCNSKYRLSLLYWNGLDDFDIRHILMEDMSTGESRCIYHINYTTWPDHGTPTSAIPILQCMRLCHMLRSTGPLIVHCSAGIGRSGTFITIDLALAYVEKQMKFNILDIVTELRRQRQGMIQTRDQYLFCYTACLECLEVEAGL